MKFSITALLALASFAAADYASSPVITRDLLAERAGVNGNRPVTNGACCIAGVSLKEDTCTVNGKQGKCVPDDINNCKAALTCIENNRLTCNAKVLERGKPTCRRTKGK